jgi:hypothetical protein
MSVELFTDQKCYVSSSWHDIEVEDQLLVKVALFVIYLSIYLFPSHTWSVSWKLHSCDDLYLPSFSHILDESSAKEKQ